MPKVEENQKTTKVEPPKVEAAEVVAPVKDAEPAKTLPQLLGESSTTLLTVLQGVNPAEKQAAITKCLREMRIWYDAQPVEGRKEIARDCRKILEQFKQVAEQFAQEMYTISAQDSQ